MILADAIRRVYPKSTFGKSYNWKQEMLYNGLQRSVRKVCE